MFSSQAFRAIVSSILSKKALASAEARLGSQPSINPSILQKYNIREDIFDLQCMILEGSTEENDDLRALLLQTHLKDVANGKKLFRSSFFHSFTEQQIYCMVASVVNYLHRAGDDPYAMEHQYQLLMDGFRRSVLFPWYSPLFPSQAFKRFGLGPKSWSHGEGPALARRFYTQPSFVQTILRFIDDEMCGFALFNDLNLLPFRQLFRSLPKDVLKLSTNILPLSCKSFQKALPKSTSVELPSLETILRWVFSFAELVCETKLPFYAKKLAFWEACVGICGRSRRNSRVPRFFGIDEHKGEFDQYTHHYPDCNPYSGWGRSQVVFVLGGKLLIITPAEGVSLRKPTEIYDPCLHLAADPSQGITTRGSDSLKRQVDRLLSESKEAPIRMSMVKGSARNVPSQVMVWVGRYQFIFRLLQGKDDGTYQYSLSSLKVSRDSLSIVWFEAVGGLTLVVTQVGVSLYMGHEIVFEDTAFDGFFYFGRAAHDVYCVDDPSRLFFTPFFGPKKSLKVGDYKDLQSLRDAFNERFSSFAAHPAVAASSTSSVPTEQSESRPPVVRAGKGRDGRKQQLQPY